MRMWMVDPKLMCRKHLLGEHFELHKHRSSFEKKRSIKGRRWQIEPLSMKDRHEELAREMILRGYKHDSPYEQPDLSYLSEEDREGKVDREESLKELERRCKECAVSTEGGTDGT